MTHFVLGRAGAGRSLNRIYPLLALAVGSFACGGPSDTTAVSEAAAGSDGGGISGSAGDLGGAGGAIGDGGDGRSCELVAAPRTGGVLAALRTARFNTDARADVIASQLACCAAPVSDNKQIYLFTGAADGALDELTTLTLEQGPSEGFPADLNGDQLSDVLVVTDGSRQNGVPQTWGVHVFLNDAAGSFQRQAPVDTTGLDGGRFLGIGDFDSDGFADLAFEGEPLPSDPPRGRVSVLLGDGDGGFGEPITTEFPYGSAPPSATAPDASDIVLRSVHFDSRGDGTFSAAQLATEMNASRVDVNLDGRLDFILGAGDQVQIFVTGADGRSPSAPTYELNAPGVGAAGAAIGDFDGDGRLDIATSSFTNVPQKGWLSVRFGRDDGSFGDAWTREPILANGVPMHHEASLTIGDIDGDGASDILANGLVSTDHPTVGVFSVQCE